MRPIITRAAMVLAMLTGPAMAQTNFANVTVFGDSLSDDGNIPRVLPPAFLQTVVPGGFLQPPYYGYHFTNGPTYAESLNRLLGVASPLQDYAYGGAFSAPLNETLGSVTVSGTNIIPFLNPSANPLLPAGFDSSLQGQIRALAASGGRASANDLYVVWGGANDYLAMATALQAQPNLSQTQALAIIRQQVGTTVGNLATDVTMLAGMGGRNFVVPLLPNLGATPSFNGSATTAQLGFTTSQLHAQALSQTMGQLAQSLGIRIIPVDLFTISQDITANPAKYGLSNVTSQCYNNAQAGLAVTASGTPATACANPASYEYWDPVHPTAATQALIAQAVVSSVEAPMTIGAESKLADIQAQSLFDALSSRSAALRQGATGLSLLMPDGSSASLGGNSDKPLSAYVIGSYGQGSRDTQTNQFGFGYSNTNVGIGFDNRIQPGFALGAMLDFDDATADLNGGMGNDEVRAYGFAVYATAFSDNWYASLAGTYNYTDWSSLNRNAIVAAQTAQANTSGQMLGAKAEAGYMLHMAGLTFGPAADFRAARMEIDAYQETGAVGLNQSVGQQNFNSLISELGAQAAYPVTSGGMTYVPNLRASWNHQFSDTPGNIATALVSAPDTTVITPLDPWARNWARLGGGVEVRSAGGLSILADFDTTLGRSDGHDYSGLVRVKYDF